MPAWPADHGGPIGPPPRAGCGCPDCLLSRHALASRDPSTTKATNQARPGPMNEVPESSSRNNPIPGSNASRSIHATVRPGTYHRPRAPACAAKAVTTGSTNREYLGAAAPGCVRPETSATPTIVTDAVAQRDLLPDIMAYGKKIMAIGNPTTPQTPTSRSLSGSGAAP